MPSYRSEEFDPITALFEDAEALHNLSSLLSEDRAGFACLLVLLADDVKRCAEALEAEEKKNYVKKLTIRKKLRISFFNGRPHDHGTRGQKETGGGRMDI